MPTAKQRNNSSTANTVHTTRDYSLVVVRQGGEMVVREIAICTSIETRHSDGSLLTAKSDGKIIRDTAKAQKIAGKFGLRYVPDRSHYHIRADRKFRVTSGFNVESHKSSAMNKTELRLFAKRTGCLTKLLKK